MLEKIKRQFEHFCYNFCKFSVYCVGTAALWKRYLLDIYIQLHIFRIG